MIIQNDIPSSIRVVYADTLWRPLTRHNHTKKPTICKSMNYKNFNYILTLPPKKISTKIPHLTPSNPINPHPIADAKY